MRRFVFALFLAFPLTSALSHRAAAAADIPAPHQPAAKALERHEKGYRYSQAGWVVVHVEGDPYPRGYQHGKLLANEIAKYAATLARDRYAKDPAEGWRTIRTLTDALFLRKIDREILEEMKGIADGAAAAGAKFEGAGSTSSTLQRSTSGRNSIRSIAHWPPRQPAWKG